MIISLTLPRVARVLALMAGLYGTAAQASPLKVDDAFCGRMQQFIAGTDMPVENVLYEEGTYWGTFKKSKPTAQPLTSHQYVAYQFADGQRADYPVMVACKMKTAERIRTAHGEGSKFTIADEDRNCQQWLDTMLSDVYQALEEQGSENLMPRERISLSEDAVYIGPFWLRPELYQVAYSEGDVMKLRTKALHVEYRRFMPVPDSFMGTHYCTMITPEYLAKLLQGEAQAPQLQE